MQEQNGNQDQLIQETQSSVSAAITERETQSGAFSRATGQETTRDMAHDAGESGGKRGRNRRGRSALFFILGLVAGILAVIIALGILFGLRGMNTDSSEVSSVVNSDSMDKLGLLEQYIDNYYYKADEVTVSQEEDGVYKGLLESLDDPYSVYYTEEEFENLQQQTEGVYYGIGAYVGTDADTGYATITGVIEGSPAEDADLQEGDIIYKVDGEDVTGEDLETIVSKIKGEEGTTVNLTVIRDGEEVEKEITRAKVDSPTVDSRMLDDNIGYLQITEFDDVTVDQFDENFQSLKDQGMQAMILDLRGNPGGNVSAVTQIANELLPKGLIFYMEDKDGNRTEYKCDGADFDLPLAVLVNGYSASASEILSGAIQDAGIGTLVGTTTYGKGVVQNVMQLDDGTAVKITVANYYTRNGRDINKKGIEPDVEIEFDTDAYREDKTDNQLDRAEEVVREEME